MTQHGMPEYSSVEITALYNSGTIILAVVVGTIASRQPVATGDTNPNLS